MVGSTIYLKLRLNYIIDNSSNQQWMHTTEEIQNSY